MKRLLAGIAGITAAAVILAAPAQADNVLYVCDWRAVTVSDGYNVGVVWQRACGYVFVDDRGMLV